MYGGDLLIILDINSAFIRPFQLNCLTAYIFQTTNMNTSVHNLFFVCTKPHVIGELCYINIDMTEPN